MHIDDIIEQSRLATISFRKIRYVLLGRNNIEALGKSVEPHIAKRSKVFDGEFPRAMGHRIVPVDLDDFSEVVYEDQVTK